MNTHLRKLALAIILAVAAGSALNAQHKPDPEAKPAPKAILSTGPVTIGPLTLGEPLPNLPDCVQDMYGTYSKGAVCKDGPLIENLPYPDANILPTVTDGRLQEISSGDLDEGRCAEVHDRLVEKFGKPTHQESSLNENGFGATWTEVDTNWHFANGDSLAFILHYHMSGCVLWAETAESAKSHTKTKAQF